MDNTENINLEIQKQLGSVLNENAFDIRYIFSDGDLIISELDNTLISCHATWSLYSIKYGRIILDTLVKADLNKIQLLIIDIDSISKELQEKLFNIGAKWGYFESCWIEKGQITKVYRYENELLPFVSYIKLKMKVIGR